MTTKTQTVRPLSHSQVKLLTRFLMSKSERLCSAAREARDKELKGRRDALIKKINADPTAYIKGYACESAYSCSLQISATLTPKGTAEMEKLNKHENASDYTQEHIRSIMFDAHFRVPAKQIATMRRLVDKAEELVLSGEPAALAAFLKELSGD